MDDARIQAYLDRLHGLPGVDKLAVRPTSYPGAPDIAWSIYVLGVPPDRLREVNESAWLLAFEMFGTVDIPFLLAPVTIGDADLLSAEEVQRTA